MSSPTTVQKRSPVDEAFALAPAHLQRLLGSPEVADRFLIVALNQVRKVPQLASCSKESILDALVRMARLGLDPSVPNEAWLLPYKQEATLLVGYGGLRKLVLRSPDVQDVFANVVCENDVYEPAETPISLPTHRLPRAFQPRGRAIGYYAAACLRSGHWRVVSMSRAEVQGHRDRYSASAKSTFWADNHPEKDGLTNFDKMAMKTVLRQLCSPRYLSLDADVAQAVEDEGAMYHTTPASAAPSTATIDRPALDAERHRQNVIDLFGEGTGAEATAGTPREHVNVHTGEIHPAGEAAAPYIAQVEAAILAQQGQVETWYVWAERRYKKPRVEFTLEDWEDCLQAVRHAAAQHRQEGPQEVHQGTPTIQDERQEDPQAVEEPVGDSERPQAAEGQGASWGPDLWKQEDHVDETEPF